MKKQDPPTHIRRIFDLPDTSDGPRAPVEGLWACGLRKESAGFSCWVKEVTPSSGLRQAFGHDPERYREFAWRYPTKLAESKDEVVRLEGRVKRSPVTLLHASHDEAHNHTLALIASLRNLMGFGPVMFSHFPGGTTGVAP